MATISVAEEIHRNFMAFQNVVAKFLPEKEGHYAVLHQQEVVGIYPDIRSAVVSANDSVGEGQYSIQRVTDKPVDLGFLSYAAGPGIAV